MHLPPAAQWRLGRGRAHAALLVLAVALHLMLLFFLRGQVAPAAWWGLLALALALLLHANWRWWKSPVGVLRWTGREWHWMPARAVQEAPVCVLRWVLDLQTVALVHAGPDGGRGTSRWLWLERGAQSPLAWTALRRALLASSTRAGQETLRAQTLAFGGTTILSAHYLSGPQTPQLEPRTASAAVSAGAYGFQDSTLR
jgi:hypothetical protein